MRYRRKNRHARANIYHEEIAAEMIRFPYRRYEESADSRPKGKVGRLAGFMALLCSLLSFFIGPYILGVIGIVLGFIAQRKGEISLGAWAIGVSAVSIILAIFILPLF